MHQRVTKDSVFLIVTDDPKWDLWSKPDDETQETLNHLERIISNLIYEVRKIPEGFHLEIMERPNAAYTAAQRKVGAREE